ncbi:MAG: signal peptidase II [Acidobacteriota bacterium]
MNDGRPLSDSRPPVADPPARSGEVRRWAWRERRLELALIPAIIVADQVTKALVRARIPLYDTVEIVPGWLNLTHIENTGAAFGLLGGAELPYKAAVLSIVAVIALLGFAVYSTLASPHDRQARAGFALIIAGAAGNLFDRIRFGAVTDFVDVVLWGWHFWVFNVADSAITVGVIAVILDSLLPERSRVPSSS